MDYARWSLVLLLSLPCLAQSRTQHRVVGSVNCSPSCTVSYASATGSGNLLGIVYASGAGTGPHLSSVTGGGSWTVGCHATDASSGASIDAGYNLSSSVITNLSVTLSANDGFAYFWVVEYSGSGTWTLDGACKTVNNPTAAEPTTMPAITTGGANDVIFFGTEPPYNYCPAQAVGNTQGSGVTTPLLDTETNTGSGFDDYVGVAAGTYQANLNQFSTCPSTQVTATWAASLFAFTLTASGPTTDQIMAAMDQPTNMPVFDRIGLLAYFSPAVILALVRRQLRPLRVAFYGRIGLVAPLRYGCDLVGGAANGRRVRAVGRRVRAPARLASLAAVGASPQ